MGIGFLVIEGAAAILLKVKTGTWIQTSVFERNGYVYVKANGGFIKVYVNGSTSNAMYKVEAIDLGDIHLGKGDLGQLTVVEFEDPDRIKEFPLKFGAPSIRAIEYKPTKRSRVK